METKELIYLWIEEYKNIKDCNFNLGSKYTFHYSKNSGNLEITSTLDAYPNTFFGKNVKNITAIIGKNGAGKSNFLEALCKSLSSEHHFQHPNIIDLLLN